jgi:hypothetical protein
LRNVCLHLKRCFLVKAGLTPRIELVSTKDEDGRSAASGQPPNPGAFSREVDTGSRGENASNKAERRLRSNRNRESSNGYDSRPIPDRLLAIFGAVLVVALVAGYLFVNKLAAISSEEDCALANRYNCAAVEVPR